MGIIQVLKKNSVLKVLLVSTFVMLMLMFTTTLEAHAEKLGEVTLDSGDKFGQTPPSFAKSSYETKSTSSSSTDAVITITGSNVKINKTFEDLTSAGQRQALNDLMKEMDKASISQQGQQSVIDMVRQANPSAGAVMVSISMSSTKADMFTALKWLEPFMPIVNFILGVLVMGIFILLILSTTVDLAYIGLPFARSVGDNNQKDNGKIPFVTWDAQSVIKEVENSIGGDGGYKNPYLIYLKRRVLTYIILAFCILYLVAGDLGTLIGWLLSLGSGIVGN